MAKLRPLAYNASLLSAIDSWADFVMCKHSEELKLKTDLKTIEEKLGKAKEALKGKEKNELRDARKRVKRLQRKKSKRETAVKKAEIKTKGKKKAPEANAKPAEAKAE